VSGLETARDHFVAHFAEREAGSGATDPEWIAPLRRAAIERFERLGLPGRGDEAWKYTRVEKLTEGISRDSRDAPDHTATAEDVVALFGADAAATGLVFENGRFAPELSAQPSLPSGVVAASLADIAGRTDSPARSWLECDADEQRAFAALNSALARDGAYVAIDERVRADEPIQLLFLSTQAAAGRSLHTRNRIDVARGARATVAFHYASLCEDPHLSNHVTGVDVGDDAELSLVTIQDADPRARQLATVDIAQGRNSRLRSHWLSLGGGVTRNEVNAVLGAPGADCELNGLFAARGDEHIDNQTRVEHASPHTTSRELYKGILDERSRGVFNGLVRVRPGAQKTSSFQSNPNLLISDDARVSTKPTLEIEADDVKCSHGSTVGRLDEEALFYLRARGIAESPAREMLTYAFASEISQAVPEALRGRVQQLVAAKLAAGALFSG
jgi:Fe-S cluster assembly protein SufD